MVSKKKKRFLKRIFETKSNFGKPVILMAWSFEWYIFKIQSKISGFCILPVLGKLKANAANSLE